MDDNSLFDKTWHEQCKVINDHQQALQVLWAAKASMLGYLMLRWIRILWTMMFDGYLVDYNVLSLTDRHCLPWASFAAENEVRLMLSIIILVCLPLIPLIVHVSHYTCSQIRKCKKS